MHVTFVGYLWNNQGIFLYSIFPERYLEYSPEFHRDLFPNTLGIYHGNVPRIFHEQFSWNIIWEYSLKFHRELFPNFLGKYHGNVPRIFNKHIFAQWERLPMSNYNCFEYWEHCHILEKLGLSLGREFPAIWGVVITGHSVKCRDPTPPSQLWAKNW